MWKRYDKKELIRLPPDWDERITKISKNVEFEDEHRKNKYIGLFLLKAFSIFDHEFFQFETDSTNLSF